jgi:hypothetical protein
MTRAIDFWWILFKWIVLFMNYDILPPAEMQMDGKTTCCTFYLVPLWN